MPLSLSLALAALLWQGRPKASSPSPPTWLAEMRSADPKVRQQGMARASASGGGTIPLLTSLLYSPNPSTHQCALQALRAIVYRASRTNESVYRRSVVGGLFGQLNPLARRSHATHALLLDLLGTVAEAQDVSKIAGYLRDPALREEARLTLTRLSYPDVNRLLLASLPLSKGVFQVGIIQSLEERDVREAIPFVQNLLRSPEAEVRIAALHALGRLADVSSAPLLWNMTEGNRLENRTALHAYLALAESLLKRGETANAQSLFTRYAQVALTPTEKCSALNGLAQCKPQDAENMLFEACFAPEKEVRAFAVRLLSENPSATVTQRMVAEIPRVAPSLRPILMEALAGRNGTAVRDALLEATLSQDHDLRVAGLRGILHRSDIYNTTRLQVFHRAIPVAQSDAERHTLLLGLRNIASSTSIPYLMDALGQGKTQNETWAAILVIADKIVRNNRPQEALPLYERAVRLCGDAQLVRHATQKMRQLGAKADFASQAGYIEHWWVLGALPGREKWRTLDAIPLQAPVEIQNPVLIAERQFRWRYFHLENPQGLLDFMEATPLQGNAAAYAYAEITSPSAQDVLLKVGSDDDYFLALNGVPVSRFVGNRGWKADEDAVQVRLVAGVNRILLKVLNGGGSWQASLRITDMSHQPLVFVQSTPQTRLQEQASASAPKPTLKERRVLLTSGLEYVELEEGKGEVAKAGDNVAVHYVGYIGTFPNAKRYDNTHERGEPFYFTLGNNQALAGFDQGIQGMKVGGKRRLVVPPSLAYGAAGFGKQVPPNATLTFEVELVSVEH